MSAGTAASSDVQMSLAAQIAYLDANLGPKNTAASTKEGIDVVSLADNIIRTYQGKDNLSGREESQLNAALAVKNMIEEHHLQNEVSSWKIINSRNNNDKSGFYGCVIETGDNEAIVAFRGSERYGDQYVKDWAEADFNLLHNTATTRQQRDAEKYMRDLYEKYGDKYSFNLSGHSLGGNLAEHAYITAPEGMNLNRCVSWDGPGFSEEYLAAYAPLIAARAFNIDHYQYSLVGTLLHHLPGTNYVTIDARDGEGVFDRHSLSHIEFDELGQVKKGSRDPNSNFVDSLSDSVEDSSFFTNLIGIAREIYALHDAIVNGDTDRFEYLNSLGIRFTNEMIEQMVNELQNLNYYMNGVSFSGEYEIQTDILHSFGDELNDVSESIRKIGEEVSLISSQLRYNSLSGSWYKSRLRSTASRLSAAVGKASDLSEVAHACANNARNADEQAAYFYQFD